MKILVTGATGFVGSHLVDTLTDLGYPLKVLVRRGTQRSSALPWLRNRKVDIVNGDINNVASVKEAVKDADVVLHLAALMGGWRVPKSEYYRINVQGTRELVKRCLEANTGHFVFLSTTGVMGRLKTLPAGIDHPCSPVSFYEKSKYQAELLVKDAMNGKGFPSTIIRPTHVYGPRDRNTLELFKLLKSSRLFPLIDGGRNLFQPIYVEDLVKALILCMEKRKDTTGKSYILAGGEKITFREFIRLSANIIGTEVITLSLPARLALASSRINERIASTLNYEPRLTCSRVEFFTRDHIYDDKAIARDIGFVPQVDLKTGLQKTIELYEENSWL